ncbi:PEP-CTERM motif protein [Rubripirellula tenax]|uniref:PEP-CTERM motif protein n=1 Tax=Rubripirellula tenax TaxID=2528015 RepID=A0A5C6ET46_9BACT|nr:DUF4465 domain-containing protein [Rubripirellula tenax]TWU50776.1 PEP-CTERM motif protein [Rubripirellula tenax]
MKTRLNPVSKLLLALACVSPAAASAATLVDFESLPIAFDANNVNVGPFVDNVSIQPGIFGGNDISSTFSAGGVAFNNTFNDAFASFQGFALSQRGLSQWSSGSFAEFFNGNDTVSANGIGNFASSRWVVAFGDYSGPDDPLANIASIMEAPANSVFDSLYVNNTRTTTHVLTTGNSSARAFGSINQDEKFTARFIDLSPGSNGSNFVEVELASFVNATSTLSIVDDWMRVDLSGLGGATRIGIDFTSTDEGAFGLNTPAYVAVDNILVVSVPEPSTWLMLAMGCGMLGWRIKRRQENLTKLV